jgi:hypothetical protein
MDNPSLTKSTMAMMASTASAVMPMQGAKKQRVFKIMMKKNGSQTKSLETKILSAPLWVEPHRKMNRFKKLFQISWWKKYGLRM